MLRPEYLEQLPDRLIELYAQLETDILTDMARRIAAMDLFSPSSEWQFRKLLEMGLVYDEIIKRLSEMTGKRKAELKSIIEEAGSEALKHDMKIYNKAGLDAVLSPAVIATLQNGLDNTNGLFDNLTRTTAQTATRQFEMALDRAYMKVSSGAVDYNTAIRGAIKELAGRGVEAITYPSGHTDTLEVAVRRAVVTGVNQATLKAKDRLADEMGADLVEVTAHSGARVTPFDEPANHAYWQGGIYSRSGTSEKYRSLVEVTGYGTGEGLAGWNCRHSHFPFFEGQEPTYNKEQLDEMNAKKYAYNGERLTEYEATQRQRYFERQIRRWKREEAAMGAAGQDTGEAAAKVAKWQGTLQDFIGQTGLKRQYDRENIQ